MSGFLRRAKPGWAGVRPLIFGGILLLVVYFLYVWHLGSLTQGLGIEEYTSRQNSQTLQQIFNHGLNAPYYLLQHGFLKIFDSSIWGLRFSSVSIALIVLSCLFSLLRGWFGKTTLFYGGIAFISTPWIALTARTAGSDIMLLWPIVILTSLYWVAKTKFTSGLLWVIFCAVAAIGIYTPGVVWLLIAGGLIARNRIPHITRDVNGVFATSGMAVALILIAPLAYSIWLEPSNARELFLIPQNWPSALDVLKSIGWSASTLVWSSHSHIDITIGRLPILNILQVALCAFGIYALASRARNMTYFAAALVIFSIIAAGINQNPHLLTIGLPAVAILLAAGLRYLYLEWRQVFPLNPFSYALAIVLISLVVGMQALYGLRYTLVAWPHTEATKSTYVLK